MILKFPDLATLRLALITEAVPLSVAQGPATAGFDDQDQVWVETAGSLPRGSQNELKKLGAQSVRSSGATLKTEVSCWPEMLPLERDRGPIERLDTTPVLFDLPSGEALAKLVLEVLRLGNERQGFRWLEEAGSKGGNGAVRGLLRVVGPPYYSLLRALDRQGNELAPVAYLERAPRIWIELGHNHPLIGRIKVPDGKMLLMGPPRQWTTLADVPFRDIYEVLEIPLPDSPVGWNDAKLKAHLKVSPTIKPAGAPEGAELWVLREDPINELNAFVQSSGDAILQRLAFAVGEHDGKKTIVLRVRQSKQGAPELVLKADAYKHYLKLPNLFLPVGTRLHPPLRRDVVRKLLAEDTSQVTWLQPGALGTFSPQGLPEDAFRPLFDWIDYVLDHEKVPLQAWVQATQFDFEPFVCEEEQQSKPKKPPAPERGKGPRSERGGRDSGASDASNVEFTVVDDEADDVAPVLDDFAPAAKAEPTEIQKQLRALEERFLAFEGGLDAPERQALWPEMARLNAALGNADDAGSCWMNALWERDEPLHAWTWNWFCAEAEAVPTKTEGTRANRSWVARVTAPASKSRELTVEELDKLLRQEEPGTCDLRALSAYVVWAARQSPPPAAFVQRLSAVSRFLEKHERLLPVRAVWLAWSHLAHLSQGDVLGLARARDRLLERLYNNGLCPEQDLPSFLRFAGQPTSQRFRAVRQWLIDLAGMAQAWIKDGGNQGHTSAQTAAYVDLIFAFGLARLGEGDPARELLNRAGAALGKKDDAHQWLLAAFKHRIVQALEGKPHTGPLPAGDVELLESMERLLRYVVDRLRKHSRILEPDQRINPYRHWGARISEFERALAELTDLTDRTELASRVEKLLADVPKGAKGNEQRARVLKAGLEAAPRVGEEFARKLLDQSIPCYDALPEAKDLAAVVEQATFLEKALFVAGHFGRMEHVHPLVARFQRMLQSQRGPQALPALDSLAAQCFRGLRKLGMRDEIDQLLRQMADLVLEGRDVKTVDFKPKDKDPHGPAALRALLQVASGWYYFGRDNQAEPVLQSARALLLQNELAAREQTQTAVSYAGAVGQAPVEVAQKRLEEVFKALKGIKDTYTTSTHFSVSQLDVVEAVVLAVVSEDFTQGTQARRWLDDDEFLVRRRIHRDMRALMAKS